MAKFNWKTDATREELACFIESKIYTSMYNVAREILDIRWQSMIKECDKADKQHLLDCENFDAKQRDADAVKFNNSKDGKEKLELLKNIAKSDKKMRKLHITDANKLKKNREKADNVYEEMMELFEEKI